MNAVLACASAVAAVGGFYGALTSPYLVVEFAALAFFALALAATNTLNHLESSP